MPHFNVIALTVIQILTVPVEGNYAVTVLTRGKHQDSVVMLLSGLQLALKSAGSNITKAEFTAARNFMDYIKSDDSLDYIEAFEVDSQEDPVKNLRWFLNAIIFNGDPWTRQWRAAAVLIDLVEVRYSDEDYEEFLETEAREWDNGGGVPRSYFLSLIVMVAFELGL